MIPRRAEIEIGGLEQAIGGDARTHRERRIGVGGAGRRRAIEIAFGIRRKDRIGPKQSLRDNSPTGTDDWPGRHCAVEVCRLRCIRAGHLHVDLPWHRQARKRLCSPTPSRFRSRPVEHKAERAARRDGLADTARPPFTAGAQIAARL